MAISLITDFSIPAATPVSSSITRARSKRTRRISPEAGRALEILGHAIEYLTDEYVHQGGPLCAHNSQVEAVQLLMAANRAIYFACPEVPTLGERLRRWLGIAPRQA